jgi:hypothetical protein
MRKVKSITVCVPAETGPAVNVLVTPPPPPLPPPTSIPTPHTPEFSHLKPDVSTPYKNRKKRTVKL